MSASGKSASKGSSDRKQSQQQQQQQPKTVLDKVVHAIRQLKDTSTKGSSRPSIVKYLKQEFGYDNATALKKAFQQGVTKGVLEQSGQSFRVKGDPVYVDTNRPQLVIEDVTTGKNKEKKTKKKKRGDGDDGNNDDGDDDVEAALTAGHGDTVTMSYIGTLDDGYEFDKASKFEFMLGAGVVIKGWDQGIVGMYVGQKRRLVVPPHLAYGKRGCSPDIPPNATLHFVVTLKALKKATGS
jgi:FKBP-type peptidyl-prolyl cis-trans isomerase